MQDAEQCVLVACREPGSASVREPPAAYTAESAHGAEAAADAELEHDPELEAYLQVLHHLCN